MSWKFGNLLNIQSWSLATKLKILHTLSLVAILSTVCIFIYSASFANYIDSVDPEAIASLKCFKYTKITLLLSALGAIILGNIIARNALIRIREFSEKMEIISANSLNERINANHWPQELKMLGDRFNAMLDRVHGSFIQLSQFSSDIAHELRNPISNLRGLTELSLAKEKTPAEYRQILESNMEEYEYLSKLIENLLFLARSDHGQITLNKQTIKVSEEISKIMEYFQPMADDKNITMVCEGDALLLVEPILFKRVINNLLSNALRYTPAQGKIAIRVNSNHGTVQISIVDTGMGIEKEHVTKIFDRFYRIDVSRSAQSGGVGLGLAIVKSIVDLHQGQIKIESQINVGTTIHLHFPLP